MRRQTKIIIGLGAVAALTTTAFIGAGVSQDRPGHPVAAGDAVHHAQFHGPRAEFRGPRSRAQFRGHGRRGFRGGGGFMDSLIEQYDGNADGKLTQAEVDKGRADQLAKFDANKDGKLTLKEYEALWLAAMRERMVDRFQAHDDDGDALVTTEEFTESLGRIIARMDHNDDGALSRDDARERSRGRGGPKGRSGRGGPRGGGDRDL